MSVSEVDYVFTGQLENAKTVLHLLQAIDLNDYATVILSDNGIRFSIEKNKSFQVSAFLQKELFEYFDLKEQNVSFKVNIRHLIDVLLSMVGSTNSKETNQIANPLNPSANNEIISTVNVSLEISYQAYGLPLVLILRDGDFKSICREMTQEPDDMILFEMPNTSALNKTIVQSEYLKNILTKFDFSNELLEIEFNDEIGLILSSSSQFAKMNVKISKNSEMINQFKCIGVEANKYRMGLLKHSVKALGQSSKASIRINNEGLLNIQYMINLENNTKCFVEYFCLPHVEGV